MVLRKKLISIIVSLMVAVTFVPITGQVAFADTPAGGDADAAAPAEDEAGAAFSESGKVAGLKVLSFTYKSVEIGWDKYNKAEGYEIYRSNTKKGKAKLIATVTACKYNDKGNKKLGKSKYYKVRAYSTVKGEKVYSKYSSVLAAKPNYLAPTGLKTSAGKGSVTVKWKGVSGTKKFQVYRATSKNGKYKKLKTIKAKKYTDKTAKDGQKYYYKVRAYGKSGKKKIYGAFSEPVKGMALLGSVAGLLVTVNGEGVVTASWNEKKSADGYELQRAGADGQYETVGQTTELSMQDVLTEYGEYIYRIRAYAEMDGEKLYGAYSAGGRGDAVAQAQSWIGCKEKDGSFKKIIDVYNNYSGSPGKVKYSWAWCATFVSAVAIKTGNATIIPVHSYCPTMLSKFANKTKDKKFTPQGGDVVFYDWNANNVPDHVGMIEKVSGNDVTAIEGNRNDQVMRRTFKKGYSLLLAYGLPNYSASNTVSYGTPEGEASAAMVAEEDVMGACEVITGAAVDGQPAEGDAEMEAMGTEPMSETETAEKIIEYIQEEDPAASAASDESAYDAFLVYRICDEMDIEASVVTVTGPDGVTDSYNEVVLDGTLYILDAAEDGGVLREYTPEEIN